MVDQLWKIPLRVGVQPTHRVEGSGGPLTLGGRGGQLVGEVANIQGGGIRWTNWGEVDNYW